MTAAMRDALEPVTRPALAAWRHPRYGFALRAVVAWFLFVEVLLQLLFGRVPQGIFVNGAVVGSLYALVAIGIILVYRANRIINFAAASVGSVPGVIALVLMSRRGLPYLAAIPITVVGAALLGALVDVAIMRRFREAPRLIVTVATIGVAQILAFVEFYVPKWVGGTDLPPTDFPTPFQRFHFNVGIVRFKGDHIVTVLVVTAIVVALGAFFRYTDMGIAVRASAENGERAQLLGIPVKRVSTVVWALAAVLSGVGVFLRAPLVGLPIGGLIGPSILLFGLAAAVIARMEHLPTAFLAGMFIGIIDQTTVFSTRRPSLAYSVMLVVVLVALLAQRRSVARALDTGAATWQTVKELRPVPLELRQLPEVASGRVMLGLLVAGLAVVLPFLVGDTRLGLLTLVVIYSIVGVSLVVLTGWAGQISLGQFGFAGIGALVAGGMATHLHADFFLTIVLAGLAGAVAAVLVGLPALRIQGLFLAVTTLAFAFSVQYFLLNPTYFKSVLPNDFEFLDRPILYGRFDASSDLRFYYVCLVFLALALGIARSVRRNRTGRILIGVRDNVRVMQAFGVSAAKTRLAAFAIAGFLAAIAGALLAYQQGSVDAGTYSPLVSITLFAMTVIGGLTSLTGAMLGAVYVLGIPYLLEGHVKNIGLLSTGFGLLVLLLFLPGGLAEAVFRVRDAYLRRIAARHAIHVPSLVADGRVAGAGDADVIVEPEPAGVEVIACPACGARVPVAEATSHPHFTAAVAP